MTSLPALIEKLRGLKGPNFAVDQEVFVLFGQHLRDAGVTISRPYTASLDAVVALIERDGAWDWSIHRDNGEAIAGVQPASEDGCDCADAHAPTPALALLIAFLEAKMEMEK